jgi:oxygen-independent coproporphyrinogen-3 oxidase
MSSAPAPDPALLRRYDRPGPRYTSYPAAPHFSSAFGERELREHAARSEAAPQRRPLSLYVHVPFCFSPCFYCGCNRLITRDPARGEQYTDDLLREIRLAAALFDPGRELVQLHLGGGTPNFLSAAALARLIGQVARSFRLSRAADRDFSIELDPRSLPEPAEAYAATLAGLGFNRASLGVQDFDTEVQQAVNRLQSVEQTLELIDACRDHGFRSINVDLIYGLPHAAHRGVRTPRSHRGLRLRASALPLQGAAPHRACGPAGRRRQARAPVPGDR